MLSLFQTKPHGCLKLHVNEDPSPDRSSHWRCCIKEGVPKNFTGKHVCQSLFFNNLQSISGRLLLTCYTIFSNILIQYSKFFFAVWIRKTVHGSRYLTWKEFTLIFFSRCLVISTLIILYYTKKKLRGNAHAWYQCIFMECLLHSPSFTKSIKH